MRRRHLVKMVVFGLAWSVIVSLCIGQTDDESFFPEIRYLRMRPKFPVPTTPHPANLEEAKRWFKEAFYADVEGLLARRLGKPESVWKGYYRQVAKLARGVYEKFGDFSLVWLVPEEEWAEFGDILLFPKDIWQDYRKMKDWEMKKGEPLFSEPIDPTLLYGLALHREALDKAKKKGKVIRYPPMPCTSSVSGTLVNAYLALGEWKEAMKFIEVKADNLPYAKGEETLQEWLSCAQRVYPKGQIPTRWLLTKGGEIEGALLSLREDKEGFFVPLWRMGWLLGWKMDEEGGRVIVEGAGRKSVIDVRQGEIAVQGERVVTKERAYQEGLEVWVPMEFLERMVVVQIAKREGYLEVQIGQRGND